MNEFMNNPIPESQSVNEYQTLSENAVVLENADVAEFASVGEFQEPEVQSAPRMNQTKKNHALSALSGSLVSVIAAVTVGITSMMNVSMAAEFDNVEYVDGSIQYQISVEDMTEKEKLTAYLYEGDNLVDSFELMDEDGDGVIAGAIALDGAAINEKLEASNNVTLSYRLTLKGLVGLNVERSFDSYVVKIEKATSAFEQVSGECKCSVDGCYHFTMDFEDNLGMFSNFSAYIEDAFGNRAQCTFTENLHEPQKIFIGNLKGANATLVITYVANGEEQVVSTEIKI